MLDESRTVLRLVPRLETSRPHRARCRGQHPRCPDCRAMVESYRRAAQPPADPAMAYRFGACNDGCCEAYVCMKCSEDDYAVQYGKGFGLRPLTLSDLEGGEPVYCDRCQESIYGCDHKGGFIDHGVCSECGEDVGA